MRASKKYNTPIGRLFKDELNVVYTYRRRVNLGQLPQGDFDYILKIQDYLRRKGYTTDVGIFMMMSTTNFSRYRADQLNKTSSDNAGRINQLLAPVMNYKACSFKEQQKYDGFQGKYIGNGIKVKSCGRTLSERIKLVENNTPITDTDRYRQETELEQQGKITFTSKSNKYQDQQRLEIESQLKSRKNR